MKVFSSRAKFKGRKEWGLSSSNNTDEHRHQGTILENAHKINLPFDYDQHHALANQISRQFKIKPMVGSFPNRNVSVASGVAKHSASPNAELRNPGNDFYELNPDSTIQALNTANPSLLLFFLLFLWICFLELVRKLPALGRQRNERYVNGNALSFETSGENSASREHAELEIKNQKKKHNQYLALIDYLSSVNLDLDLNFCKFRSFQCFYSSCF